MSVLRSCACLLSRGSERQYRCRYADIANLLAVLFLALLFAVPPVQAESPVPMYSTGIEIQGYKVLPAYKYTTCARAAGDAAERWGKHFLTNGNTIDGITLYAYLSFAVTHGIDDTSFLLWAKDESTGATIWGPYPRDCTVTYVCPTTNKIVSSATSPCPCVADQIVTGTFEELSDGCHNGCSVRLLSPQSGPKWERTLLGKSDGSACTDAPESNVSMKKMLGCGTGSGGLSTKSPHPIDFAFGNKYFSETDYRGSGVFPIILNRSYNSFDLGWRISYTQRIESVSPNKVRVNRPNGRVYEFSLSGGQWLSDPDVIARLEWDVAIDGHGAGWRYMLPDRTQELFDEGGRLIAIRNPAGLEQTIAYSDDGRHFTVSSPDGDWLEVELNASGSLPQGFTDRMGLTTAYHYNGLQLQQVSYPNGTSKQYLYEVAERPWLITGIIDEKGNRSRTVAYDGKGRAIMSELANGAERVDVSYGEDGSATLVNALGKRTRFQFETRFGVKKIVHVEGEPTQTCQGSAMDYRFDGNGFLIEKTDAEGVITRYIRGEHGVVLSRTDAAGLPESRTVTTQWDTELRLPILVSQDNTETRYSYDTQGRLLEVTRSDIVSGASRTTRYSYNSFGLLDVVDGPREDVADTTRYSYDSSGHLSSVTNAMSHVSRIVSRDAYGRPRLISDSNGVETTLSYDGKGHVIERSVNGESTRLEYDATGNLTSITSPDGSVLEYHYDAANRLIGIGDSSGNRIAYTLDAMGNRTSEEVFDAGGQLVRAQSKVYDELSRLLKSVGAAGQLTTYGYDRNNNLVTTIDPLWQIHTNAYDGLNRLVEQIDPLNGVTRYSYDAQDHIAAVTDPNGNITTYVYDGLGNLLEQHSPDTGVTVYSYDSAGNVLSRTDAKGQTTHYQYDAINRLVRITYADGSEVIYEYDTADNGIGRLARVTDPSGSTAWQYDNNGRTTSRIQTVVVDGVATELTTAWEYNAVGQLSVLTYPSSTQVNYSYSNGQISAISVNGQSLLAAISYQPFGPVNGWTWGNGSQSWRGYDLDGRLIGQSLGSAERNLTYDPAGNITAISEPSNSQNFGYDALSRLTAVNDSSYALSWNYDANGNRLSELSGTESHVYSTDTSSNRLLAVDSTAYEYDANGNLVDDGEHSYQYDARGRLVTVDEGSSGAYRYNASGQRIYKIIGDGRDYLAMAETARNEAEKYREQVSVLMPQVASLKKTTAQLQAEIRRTERTVTRAERKAGRLEKQALRLETEAEKLSRQVISLQAEIESLQASLTTEPVNFWQRIEQRLIRWKITRLESQLGKARTRAEQATSVAGSLREKAVDKRTETEALAGQVADLKQQASAKASELDTLQKEIHELREQAKTAMLQAAEYQSMVDNQGTVVSQARLFAYDSWRLLGEYGSVGNVVQETVWLGNLPVATVQSGRVYFIHADHLGTPRVITDASNAEVWRWISEPFGRTPANEDPDGDGDPLIYNLRFPGQYYDGEIGRHYNYFRDYDPGTGRYIQSDPIGLIGGLNTYSYALNNPVMFTDSLGLFTGVIYIDPSSINSMPHSAIYIDGDGRVPFLYDPAGSFPHPNGDPRGQGNDIYRGNEVNISDYVQYHVNNGDAVRIIPMQTSITQERNIIERIMRQDPVAEGGCAIATSDALSGTCGFETPLLPLPGYVYEGATNSQCR